VTVRILFVEDSQDDVELQLRRLRDAGLAPQWERVQTDEALRAALADESLQVALVDYNIPGFSGIEALRLIAQLAPDLPAITVSGSIDEDTAVATIAAGAMDYVLKDNLTRLAPAVRRAIDSADLRRAHREAAEAARLALFAVDHASLSINTAAADGTVVYVNDLACRAFAAKREDVVG
jgi:DNA-binding NtrC family response regulator